MNSITINGMMNRGGEWVKASFEVTKRADGTWRTSFCNILQETSDASKSGAVQSRNYDTYEPEPVNRKKLTGQEIAELAGKYDLHNMTQAQYDAFLDELVEKGALTRSDTSWLGRGGFQRIDVDLDTLFANGGMAAGPIRIVSLDNYGGAPKRSLEEAENDVIIWLESMLTRQSQEIGGSRQKAEALSAFHDIVRRM